MARAPGHATTMTAGTALSRGLRKRCPRCGQGKVFRTYFRMNDVCSVCGYAFLREPGYWTGAMTVNIAACEAWFFVLFVGTLVATLPDVNWPLLLVLAVVTNGLFPVVFFPYSRTLWMSLDLYFHPADASKGIYEGGTRARTR
ncbi:MAG: DUF983 domain-containing protein [Actinomycetota bacterium]